MSHEFKKHIIVYLDPSSSMAEFTYFLVEISKSV